MMTSLTLSAIKLVGITARTNTKSEMDPTTASIPKTVQRFFHEKLYEQIESRKNPGIVYCVYTDYESDAYGDYTYFIGEEVSDFESQDLKIFTPLTIPAQTYQKFTSNPGPMPHVCIELWQKIWNMSAKSMGGERSYLADFEVYDTKNQNHEHVVLNIYVGIRALSTE